MAGEGELNLKQIMFEAKVSDLLVAVGFERTDDEGFGMHTTGNVLRTLKEWGIVNYSPGITFSSHIVEKRLALLVVPQSAQEATVCLYGTAENSFATGFIAREALDDNDQSVIKGTSAAVHHIRLFPNDKYKFGGIEVGPEMFGFRGGGAFNDPFFKKVPRYLRPSHSLDQRIAKWMQTQRASLLRDSSA